MATSGSRLLQLPAELRFEIIRFAVHPLFFVVAAPYLVVLKGSQALLYVNKQIRQEVEKAMEKEWKATQIHICCQMALKKLVRMKPSIAHITKLKLSLTCEGFAAFFGSRLRLADHRPKEPEAGLLPRLQLQKLELEMPQPGRLRGGGFEKACKRELISRLLYFAAPYTSGIPGVRVTGFVEQLQRDAFLQDMKTVQSKPLPYWQRMAKQKVFSRDLDFTKVDGYVQRAKKRQMLC
ncbi:hypothetical protein LTS18_012723 [Coniosporium uncinatum]|uniref:Uncharacterized protein n=1 Tax=Coniosporium uncinatum TaxID=93489 RepID=A0ACC3DCK1_9PEZI|nr:hypothetical protein LTS18_012723 [Coniosporium uncinatum]